MDGFQAFIAVNTSCFFPRIGFPVVDQGGLRNQRAAQRNKIRLLILNDVLHHGRRFQAAHGDDRDRNLFFDFRSPPAEITLPGRFKQDAHFKTF
jgi:hypothetical protein